jgi:hypothetical protein
MIAHTYRCALAGKHVDLAYSYRYVCAIMLLQASKMRSCRHVMHVDLALNSTENTTLSPRKRLHYGYATVTLRSDQPRGNLARTSRQAWLFSHGANLPCSWGNAATALLRLLLPPPHRAGATAGAHSSSASARLGQSSGASPGLGG